MDKSFEFNIEEFDPFNYDPDKDPVMQFYRDVREAVALATAEGIKANSIVLNSNLVKVPEVFGMNPPMICGLRAYVTTLELPDGYAFSVQDDRMDSKPVTNGDRIRAMDDDQLIAMLSTSTLCDWIQDNEGAFCDNHATCDGCLKEWIRESVQPTATADEDPHEHSGLVED